MGTGSKYQRAALGQAMGESAGIQAHEIAMIPIFEQQAESELKIKAAAFEQETAHIETLSDILKKVPGSQPQQITYSQAAAQPAPSPVKKYLPYLAIGLIAWLYLR